MKKLPKKPGTGKAAPKTSGEPKIAAAVLAATAAAAGNGWAMIGAAHAAAVARKLGGK